MPVRLKRPLWTAGALLVVVALAVLPLLARNAVLISVSRVAVLGLLAVSTALLTGAAGLPTLGQVAPYLVGAYTAAHLANAHVAAVPQLLAAAGAGAVFALVTGAAVVQTRGVVCLMATLAIGELTAIGAGQWRSLTGGTDGMPRVPAFPAWGGDNLVKVPDVYSYTVTVAVVIVALVLLVLASPWGRLVRGCRDNEARMRASGHRVSLYLLWTYVGAGAVAGAGGALLIAVQRTVSPADGGFDVSALVLLAVVIGGAASVVGSIAGVGAVVAVRDWIAPGGKGPLLLGALFVLAVYFLPKGLSRKGNADA